MRAVVQRVRRAAVSVADEVIGAIGPGLLVYAAAAPDDAAGDIEYIAEKIAHLRIFPDAAGKLNRSVQDSGNAVLLVSAFTVQADARKGRRPSLDGAAPGEAATALVDGLALRLRSAGLAVETGRFGAYMLVDAVNDGPICVLLDSRRLF